MATPSSELVPHSNGSGEAPLVSASRRIPEIYPRMAQAVADICAVPKTRKNDFHGYQFRGIDDVLTAVHPILAKHGLFMTPNIEGDAKVVERASTKGKAELHVVVKVRWTVYAPDGSFIEASTMGEASDTGDKGCNKAMSASQKYALIQIFSIPVEGEDRDTENRSPEFKAEFKERASSVDDYMRQGSKPALPPPKDPTAADLLAELQQIKTVEELTVWNKATSKARSKVKQIDEPGYTSVVSAVKALGKTLKEGPEPPADVKLPGDVS